MPSISNLYTALSGMNAQRRILDVTGHNVANESTPGYHRQRVELRAVGGTPAAAVFAGQGARPSGVEDIGVSRSHDVLLEARAVREDAGRASTQLLSTTMLRIEGIFGEPSDVGIAAHLGEFWGGWSDVVDQPGGLTTRTQLLERASALVDSLHEGSAALRSSRDTAVDRMVSLAIDVNDTAAEIASLNRSIVGNASAANDLIDRRDLLVASLAKLTGAVARPSGNGQVDVYIGGRTIVAGAIAQPVDGAGGALRWALDGQPVAAASGEAAALTATIADVVPRYLAALDDVAATLVAQVNALHTAGFDQAGTTGRAFFDPAGVTAATISLSVDVAGLPGNIAAGAPVLPGPTAPGPLDAEQARALAALADGVGGADAKFRSMIGGLAVETRGAIRRASVQEQVADAAVRDAEQIGAVSTDEEMASLIAAQRAFEASARVLTAVDELLGILIERTGVVGR